MLDVAKGMVTRNTVELCSALDMAAALHDLSICRDVFKVFFFQPKIVTNYSDELVKKLRLCVSMYTMGAIKGLQVNSRPLQEAKTVPKKIDIGGAPEEIFLDDDDCNSTEKADTSSITVQEPKNVHGDQDPPVEEERMQRSYY